MSKAIKVIDLLNKIANGEEVPEKFKMLSPVLREEMIFTYNTKYKVYLDNKNSPISMNLSDNLQNLNDTIEIIEEEPEIDIQEIEELEVLETDDRYYAPLVIDSKNKINELIKAVKQLDHQINNR